MWVSPPTHTSVCCSLPRHWLAVEYIWVLVPYMTYDIYVMYLCHWHKSQEKGVAEKKHSLASVRSFLLQERLMVTHHLFILIVLTPVAQVRAGHGCCARSPVGVSLGVTADGCITAGPSLAQRASFPASPSATASLLSPDVPDLEHRAWSTARCHRVLPLAPRQGSILLTP